MFLYSAEMLNLTTQLLTINTEEASNDSAEIVVHVLC